MKHLKLSLTDKNYYLLQRIAQADEIKNNALKLIKEDYKEIEENIIKENTPNLNQVKNND